MRESSGSAGNTHTTLWKSLTNLFSRAPGGGPEAGELPEGVAEREPDAARLLDRVVVELDGGVVDQPVPASVRAADQRLAERFELDVNVAVLADDEEVELTLTVAADVQVAQNPRAHATSNEIVAKSHEETLLTGDFDAVAEENPDGWCVVHLCRAVRGGQPG
jgi:hypothetical protein